MEHKASLYLISIDALITARPGDVRHLLTDYAHLNRINDSIKKSEVVQVFSPVRQRVYTLAELCVAIFCRRIKQVQDMTLHSDGHLEAIILPEDSDLRSGFASWHLIEDKGDTRILFYSEIEPAFWAPPFIGAWLVKHMLRRESLETLERIEMEAR